GGLDAAHQRAVEAIRSVRERLAGPLPPQTLHPPRPEPRFESNMPREQFEAMVARIGEYIHAGDCYPVVPSQRWSAPSPVETYSHVLHIVSSVAGTLRPEVGAIDALRSLLPAGTLSGAPKIRAMEIIDELEPVKRGAYGGAVGWLSYGGELDTCICIRTVVVKDGTAHIQAGGGTVADAQPAYEYEESRAKARGVVRAIELPATQGAWAGPR